MAEQCYFINPNFEAIINLAQQYSENFDIAGRIQVVDSLLSDLQSTLDTGIFGLDVMLDRQSKQQATLINLMRDISKDIYLEKTFAGIGIASNFNKDTFNVWSSKNPILEWESVTIEKVSEDFDIIQGNFVSELVNDRIVSVSADTKAKYTRVHYKLSPGKTAAAILEVGPQNIATRNGVMQIFTKAPASDFLEYYDFASSFFNIPSFTDKIIITNSLSELVVYYKNNLIDNKNYLYAEAYPIEILRDEIITGSQVWKSDKEISNINAYTVGDVICDLSIVAEGKTYNMQCPNSTGEAFSRLELLGYSADKNSTYFRFPFPVTLTSSVYVYKNLDIGNKVLDWEFNFDGPSSTTWYSQSDLNSTTQYPNINIYSSTKRYLYIRVNSFCESGYASYMLNQAINSAWPLSEDKKFLWSGNGIECKATGPIEITAMATLPYNKTNWDYETLGFVFPLVQLGIS